MSEENSKNLYLRTRATDESQGRPDTIRINKRNGRIKNSMKYIVLLLLLGIAPFFYLESAMQVSTLARYGLRAIIRLTELNNLGEPVVSVKRIAEMEK